MKYEAVIFDLDGTLVDTIDDLRASVNLALAQQGFPPRTREEIRAFVGNGVRKLMERSVPQGTPPQVTDVCLAAFRAHYHTHACVHTRPYDGIPAVLEALRAAGMKTAVVTNTASIAIVAVRHALNFLKLILKTSCYLIIGSINFSAGVSERPRLI